MNGAKKRITALLISAAMFIISLVGCYATFTSFGKISVNNLRIVIPSGEIIRAVEYRPDNASKDTPVPAVILSPGNDSIAERLEGFAIELSRRGAAVYLLEMTSAGRSTVVQSMDTVSNGMYDLIEYVYNTLDYVDKNWIGIGGYSKGGNNTISVLDAYGAEQREDPDGYVQRVRSAFIMTPMFVSMEGFATGINVGFDVGLFDPYSRISFAPVEGYFPGDLSVKSEIKQFINWGVAGTFSESELNDPNVKIELGKVYGDYSQGSGRVVYNAATATHGSGAVDSNYIKECTQFFMDTLPLDDTLAAGSQIWQYHAAFSVLGLLSLIALAVTAAVNLAYAEPFRAMTRPAAVPVTELKTGKSKALFVIVTLLVAFCAPAVGPFLFSNVGKVFHIGDQAGFSRWFLLGSVGNSVLLMMGTLALVNALVLVLFMKVIHKNLKLADIGGSITFANAVRTVAVAAVSFLMCYVLVCFADAAFTVTFNYNDLTFPPLTLNKFLIVLRYVPFTILFWIFNSLLMNGLNRFKGMREGLNLALCVVCNIIGMFVVCLVYYTVMLNTGAGFGPSSNWKVYMSMLYMLATVSLGTIVNRRVYIHTGNIYLGPVVYGTIITFINYCTYMLPAFIY